MPAPNNFYNKLPKHITDSSLRLRSVLESGDVDIHRVMKAYFQHYWKDFQEFWKQSGETPEWITFACSPQNGEYFVQWVYFYHYDVMRNVNHALDESGWE